MTLRAEMEAIRVFEFCMAFVITLYYVTSKRFAIFTCAHVTETFFIEITYIEIKLRELYIKQFSK